VGTHIYICDVTVAFVNASCYGMPAKYEAINTLAKYIPGVHNHGVTGRMRIKILRVPIFNYFDDLQAS
jgi:hypothetical protein